MRIQTKNMDVEPRGLSAYRKVFAVEPINGVVESLRVETCSATSLYCVRPISLFYRGRIFIIREISGPRSVQHGSVVHDRPMQCFAPKTRRGAADGPIGELGDV